MNSDLIPVTEAFVRMYCSPEHVGHDWWHIERVRQMALRLAREEGADVLIVELAALLHDLSDYKFSDVDDETRAARMFLESHHVDEQIVRHVCEIIATLSFKGAGVPTPMRTIEGKCVQDADRLDALGAIGIARCFGYSGYKRRPMYDPTEEPKAHESFASYKKVNSSALMHFYEKLFLLKDRMNTATAKKIAQERDAYMHEYVERFKNEWDGKD